MEVFTGSIMMFGFGYAPVDWSTCAGQSLSVSQYQAVYALLGNTFGGNASAFNLPNLQGRVPLGAGNGQNLTPRVAGQFAGDEAVTLGFGNLPAHTHGVDYVAPTSGFEVSTNSLGNTTSPSTTNPYLSASGSGVGTATIWSSTLSNPAVVLGGAYGTGGSVTVLPTGNGVPAPAMNPFLVLNFCIALQGLFPPRP